MPDFDNKPANMPDMFRQRLAGQAADLYQDGYTLLEIGEEMMLDQQKVRKLLITAGVYESETADKVLALKKEGRTIAEIMQSLGLSRSSVSSYLPYTKGLYKSEQASPNSERIALCRRRKSVQKALAADRNRENLMRALDVFQGYPFRLADGTVFRYRLKDDILVIDGMELQIRAEDVENAMTGSAHDQNNMRDESEEKQADRPEYMDALIKKLTSDGREFQRYV